MGIIGSIRKHSGWAVAIVGIAIVAFIIGDLTRNGNSIPDAGKVNGKVLTSQRYNELVEEAENNYKTRNQTAQVPSEVEYQLREQVWQQYVSETLKKEQTDKLGLTVGVAELNDMYTGQFIHPYVRQSFTNPQTGQLDMDQINYWIDNFDQIDTMRRMQWVELEKAVKEERAASKYNTLIASGFYMPKTFAKVLAKYENSTANVRVVAQLYQNVADDAITVEEADYQKYYNEHKAEFKNREEYRTLKFITFPVNPTMEDLAAIEADVMRVWAEFDTIDAKEVPFFVNAESDRSYDSSYVKASELKAPYDELVANASEGDRFAPVLKDNEWTMARVMKTAMRPDSVRVSIVQILNENAQRYGANVTRTADQAKHLADSVMDMLAKGAISIEQAVDQFSDDPQKAENHGGDEWQPDGYYYSFINDKIIETPVGGQFVVEDPRGIGQLVVRVNGKTPLQKKYRVATISRAITPSNNTNNARYREASQFAMQNRSLDAFLAAARESNLQVRDAQALMMSEGINGLANTRSLVQWAYNEDTKMGDVSDVVYESDGMFIVAALEDIYAKGYVPLNQVRQWIEQPVRIEKKAEFLLKNANEAVAAAKDIASIAVKLNAAVDTIDSVAFTDYSFGRFGMEPKVQAAIAAGNTGLVGPVKGASGVYMVQIDGKNPAEVSDEAIIAQLSQSYMANSRMIDRIADAILLEKAKVTDQRNKFF